MRIPIAKGTIIVNAPDTTTHVRRANIRSWIGGDSAIADQLPDHGEYYAAVDAVGAVVAAWEVRQHGGQTSCYDYPVDEIKQYLLTPHTWSEVIVS